MTYRETSSGQPVKRVAVIGSGPAGMAAAGSLASLGFAVDWYEKEDRIGGKLNEYHQLFPDRETASAVLADLGRLCEHPLIVKHLNTTVSGLQTQDEGIAVCVGQKPGQRMDAVVMAHGFDFFDARRKEEFGYGIYRHVITSVELEGMLKRDATVLRTNGNDPSSIVFVHCVGSRDEQVGVPYCSRLCCITGIKQAIEVKELYPDCRITNFYIDMRTFGKGYEELYRKAQEIYGIRFIRGRVSEASEDHEKRIRIKAEDTLLARPVKMTVDWIVLLIGMSPSCTGVVLNGQVEQDQFTALERPVTTLEVQGMPGVFAAGCCTGPMSIPESVAAGRSAAMQVLDHLSRT